MFNFFEHRTPWAIGSGACLAIGALHAGGTAEKAVEIARNFDTGTGGPIDYLEATELKQVVLRKRKV